MITGDETDLPASLADTVRDELRDQLVRRVVTPKGQRLQVDFDGPDLDVAPGTVICAQYGVGQAVHYLSHQLVVEQDRVLVERVEWNGSGIHMDEANWRVQRKALDRTVSDVLLERIRAMVAVTLRFEPDPSNVDEPSRSRTSDSFFVLLRVSTSPEVLPFERAYAGSVTDSRTVEFAPLVELDRQLRSALSAEEDWTDVGGVSVRDCHWMDALRLNTGFLLIEGQASIMADLVGACAVLGNESSLPQLQSIRRRVAADPGRWGGYGRARTLRRLDALIAEPERLLSGPPIDLVRELRLADSGEDARDTDDSE